MAPRARFTKPKPASKASLSLQTGALAKIEAAKRSHTTALSLARMGLTLLSDSIGELIYLRYLDLSSNPLSALPDSIGDLSKLEHLDLSDVSLGTLPDFIGRLINLRYLRIRSRQLTKLSDLFGRLTLLHELDIHCPGLTTLPESIAQLRNLEVLNLSGSGLRVLPSSIGALSNLQILNLSENALGTLPDTIADLGNLQELTIRRNLLTKLPKRIGQLAHLQRLDLYGNQLTTLPASIGQLSQLQLLDLYCNLLTALPESIGQLVELRELNLYGNRLRVLNNSIGGLSQLQVLDLYGNRITALPQSIGQLKNLHQLKAVGNRLSELPVSIGSLPRLEVLDLYGNRLEVLPASTGNLKQLRLLDVSCNQLVSLPQSLGNLTNLEGLFLHKNPGLPLPFEVLGPTFAEAFFAAEKTKPATPSEVLEYYFRTQQGKRPLNEAKLVLVGRGEVGKTSIVNRLLYDTFDPNEITTKGIKIDQWKLLVKNQEVRLNVWDFGGQEIMHATHQFFLTQRSLYLLVLSGRGGTADLDVEYWLKLIESFGSDSPVIVVLNKIRTDHFDVNRRALKGKYPAIRAFVETDCKDGFGMERLLQHIEHETDLLEGLRDPFPASWFKIKDELAGMKDNFLTFEQYRSLCSQLGESDLAAQEMLTIYLHRLGIALNYRDDPRLRDTHVLNPHWVTNGIYTILNSDLVKASHGDIRLQDIPEVLNESDYPRLMHRVLMDLMKKFDLCFVYPHDDIRYLIPELLDKQEPQETVAFNERDGLKFRYEYPILPEGLLPRFIVRTHVLSNEATRWRTGAMLEFEGCRALVKADVQDRRVDVSVAGPTDSRRRLLAVIRANFEQIHRDIKDLKPCEMVPLVINGEIVTVSYQDLRVREESGKVEFDIVVGGVVVPVNALELLNGVDLEGTRQREGGMSQRNEPVRVFYSYSHKDEPYREQLETHLKILQRMGMIQSWTDRLIQAGEEWDQKIDENLERAQIVVLLISADFIASDYCYEVEMKRALQRHEEGRTRVVPIIVRDCNWKIAQFAKLNALPKDGKAVATWTDKDAAWKNVAEGIQRLVETIRRKERDFRP